VDKGFEISVNWVNYAINCFMTVGKQHTESEKL